MFSMHIILRRFATLTYIFFLTKWHFDWIYFNVELYTLSINVLLAFSPAKCSLTFYCFILEPCHGATILSANRMRTSWTTMLGVKN